METVNLTQSFKLILDKILKRNKGGKKSCNKNFQSGTLNVNGILKAR